MHQHPVHAVVQFVVCASRSPAVAGNQSIGRAEMRRAALRTQLSNAECRSAASGKPRRDKALLAIPGNDPSIVRGHPRLPASQGYFTPGRRQSSNGSLLSGQARAKAKKPMFACCEPRSRKFNHTSVFPRARPTTSLKGSTNGRPPGPGRWYAVHFHRPGPGVLPLVPP